MKFLQLNPGRRKDAQDLLMPDLGVGDFLETDAGFVWVEVAGVRVYSCYFSPGDPFDVLRPRSSSLRKASVTPSGDPS